MKYQVTLTLELEIDAPTREAAEILLDGIVQVAEWAERGVKICRDDAEWEDDDVD